MAVLGIDLAAARTGVTILAHGLPAPAGSKRAYIRGGKAIVVDDSARSRPWKQEIAGQAAQAMADRPLLAGPIQLEITFTLPRPKGHYGRRGLRPSAPEHPAVRPDLLKLARAIEDALTGIVYRDDAQIVDEHLRKAYGDRAVTVIHAHELNTTKEET